MPYNRDCVVYGLYIGEPLNTKPHMETQGADHVILKVVLVQGNVACASCVTAYALKKSQAWVWGWGLGFRGGFRQACIRRSVLGLCNPETLSQKAGGGIAAAVPGLLVDDCVSQYRMQHLSPR